MRAWYRQLGGLGLLRPGTVAPMEQVPSTDGAIQAQITADSQALANAQAKRAQCIQTFSCSYDWDTEIARIAARIDANNILLNEARENDDIARAIAKAAYEERVAAAEAAQAAARAENAKVEDARITKAKAAAAAAKAQAAQVEQARAEAKAQADAAGASTEGSGFPGSGSAGSGPGLQGQLLQGSIPTWAWAIGGLAVVGAAVYLGRK